MKKRSTRRVAEGPWRGELEEKIVKLRCLDKEISDKLSGGKYSGAVVLIEEDFDRIKSKKALLIEEINHFLDLQEVLLQDEMTDIDEHLKREYSWPHRDYLIAQRDVLIKKI